MPPAPGTRHLPLADWNILLDVHQSPLRTMSSLTIPDLHLLCRSHLSSSPQTTSTNPDHLQVPSHKHPPTPPPADVHLNQSPEPNDSASNLAQTLRTFPSPLENSSTEPLPHPLASLVQSIQQMTLQPPGVPETGLPQMTNGTPPPGLSDHRPQNFPNENNAVDETTSPESPRSSLPTNQVSMTDFLNAISVANQATIHRTVKITSAQSATHSTLIISLNIAHNYTGVNEFLSQGLPTVIHALTDLRMTTVIRPPSATSQTSHTSEEEEEEELLLHIVRITDDREPISITTPEGEERTFVLVRYVNGVTIYEAGTLNVNRE
ncbi:hypothetical protein Moror_3869 [Moniliophthora roreri MCA 2997]|uniref:Uncharacterized protein n=1 Tax=Moniliophthora roreri (strain MCA 2997) TaxID=1381753 RepID=V2XNP3_MONRO|nr:hypothetical protein Moror_3869 [Moniliophthora roreri MCA 2997]